MTYEEAVARLTLAIDDDSAPPVDGNATVEDEVTAALLLERLIAAYNGAGAVSAPVATGSSYSRQVAAREAAIEAAYQAFDRSMRSLMTIVVDHASRYPDEEFDFRGNPIPVELRGAIRNETVRGWNLATPVVLSLTLFRRGGFALFRDDGGLESHAARHGQRQFNVGVA